MIRSADVRTDSEARSWEARLNREWPQRSKAAAWIAARISASSTNSPRVVELACGAGFLAEVLTRQLPGLHYCGFDLSPYLLDYARRRFVDDRKQRDHKSGMEFRHADLVNDDWTSQLVEMEWAGKIDAVVSIQAFHDLGNLSRQSQVLRQARGLLRVGGLLAYSDLLFDAEKPHSSRYSKEEHEEMLRTCGYSVTYITSFDRHHEASGTQRSATDKIGEFGCFAGHK